MSNDIQELNLVEADPVTGEIISPHPEGVNADTIADYGRWMANIERSMRHLATPLDGCLCDYCNLSREIRKLNEIHCQKREKLEQKRLEYLGLVEQFVAASGQRVIATPGVGRFRFRKLTASLDCTVYNESDNATRGRLHSDRPGVFNVKEVVTPDKEVIKKRVQEGDELLASYFSIKTGEKFEFKADS